MHHRCLLFSTILSRKYQPNNCVLVLFIKTPLSIVIVLLLIVMQKPKVAWLLNAKTEASFCLHGVHLIILDWSHWLSFSSYQLQIGPAARALFLQHRNELIIEVCQRRCTLPGLNKKFSNWNEDCIPSLFNRLSIHDMWNSADRAKVLSVKSLYTFTRLQFLFIVVSAENITKSYSYVF